MNLNKIQKRTDMVVMPQIQQTIAKSVNQGDIQCSPQGLQQVGFNTKQLTLYGPEKKPKQSNTWVLQCQNIR